MNERKADFILKGEEILYPAIVKDGLELYYDMRGKTNQDARKNVILDMSGKGRNATLTGFDYKGNSGHAEGLVFDERDDKLNRPAISGLDPNNLTFQINGNIVRFKADGTSQMVQDGQVVEIGRNLLTTNQSPLKEFAGTREYVNTYDLAPIFDTFGLIEYTISFDIKSKVAGIMNVYMQNGTGSRYGFSKPIEVNTEWERKSVTITPFLAQPELTQSMLAFYGWYDSGRIPTVRSIKVEKGAVATPYTPSPEDLIANLDYPNNVLGDLEDVIDDMDINRVTDTSVTLSDLKDNHVEVTVSGNTVQQSDWYAKDGLSTQYQDTKVMGKNICPTDFSQWESGNYSFDNGSKTVHVARIRLRNYLPVTPNTTYYFNTFETSASYSPVFLVRAYDENKNFVSNHSAILDGQTLTTGSAVRYLGISIYTANEEVADLFSTYQSLFLSGELKPFICLNTESNKTYEPYKDSIKNGLVLEYNGGNFFNSPQTTSLKDRSGNGNHGTPSGFSYTTTSGSDGNGGIKFDGVDDYIQIPIQSTILSDFTAEWNVKINSLAGNSSSTYLFNTNQSGGLASNPIIYISGSGKFSYWAGSNNYGTISIQTGVDYHLCAIRSGNIVTLKVNNIVALTYTDNSTPVATNKLYIGGTGDPNRLNGTLKSFRFYNRALSDSEVYQNYMAGTNLNMPSPEDPSPVVSNLPAGTYKYTSTDGIYEFTLDEELRGIGASVDRIVFDRVSKQGKLERRVGKKVFDGTESWYIFYNGVALGSWCGRLDGKLGDNKVAKGYLSNYFKEFAGSSNDLNSDGKFITYYLHNTNWIIMQHPTLRNDLTSWKAWLSSLYSSGSPLYVIYILEKITTTPLTFTKVSSSTKTEVPMTFFTSTPSLEYPAQVWDGGGKVVSRGKNLFDSNRVPMNYGVISESFENGYKIYSTAPNAWAYCWFNFILKPRTTYRVSYKLSNSYGFPGCDVYSYNNTQPIVGTYIFTTPVDGKVSIRLWSNMSANKVISGATYTDIQLEEGSTATAYEPYKPIAETTLPTLRKIGTVADTYDSKTGLLTKRISDWVTLDGSISWWWASRYDNYKSTRISCSLANMSQTVSDNLIILRYDSTKIPYSGLQLYTNTYWRYSNNILYLLLDNEMTGWGENVQVDAVGEIRAYFYGWKMCNADGTSPYYKSEIPYNPTTWAEWEIETQGTFIRDSTGMKMIADGANFIDVKIPMNFKISTKYGVILNVVEKTTIYQIGFRAGASQDAFTAQNLSLVVGNNKTIFTTNTALTSTLVWFFLREIEPAGNYIKFKDIRIFELPTGSQIEADFTNLTADQLAAKYTFNGLCVKHWKKVTDGTGLTSTLPTASYEGYTPYKMIYQLATPVVTQFTEPGVIPAYYPTTVLETDAPDYCKPAITAAVKSIDYLKETRTINNLLLWSRALSDPELIRMYRMFHERYRMKSSTVGGVPIEGFVWLGSGGSFGSDLSTDITLNI